MNKKLMLSIVNFLGLLAVIIFNYLANALPINDKTTGEISDKFLTLFKPAGYVFSIWGVIYVALIVFAVYQLLPKAKNSGLVNIIGIYFIVNCVSNVAWLFAWHHEKFELSVLIMLVILYTLIKIYTNIHTAYLDQFAAAKWTVFVPFSIYFAWICVATIANITIYLYSINWSGFGISPIVWFILLLSAGLGLGFFILKRFNDVIFVFVLIWAYWGIAIQNKGNETVALIAWIACSLMILVSIIKIFKSRTL